MPQQTHLIFPPFSEAVLFPYLSLPMLAAVLKTEGFDVKQHDVTLFIIKELVKPSTLIKLKKQIQKNPETTAQKIRLSLVNYALENPNLWQEATEKSVRTRNTNNQERAIRMIKKIMDLALELSIFGLKIPNQKSTEDRLRQLIVSENHEDVLLQLISKWVDNAIDSNAKLIGISIPFFSQILPSLALAHLIKLRNPNCLIVFGGPQIWLHFERLCSNPYLKLFVDALCFGQGEKAIVDLAKIAAKSLISRPQIENLRWVCMDCETPKPRPDFLDQTFPDINSLPSPLFNMDFFKDYLIDEIQLPLITCFGCYWGRCTFCSYGNRYHLANKYQEYSSDKLAAVCIDIMEKCHATRINFVDENTNLKLIIRTMRILKNKGYKLTFSTRNRFEKSLLNKKMCKELRDLGCVLMSIGYETNSQRLLDKLNRGLDAQYFQKIIDNLYDVGITVRLSVMGSILDEEQNEMLNSIDFLKKNERKIGIDSTQKLIAEPMTMLSQHSSPKDGYSISTQSQDWNKLMNFGFGRVGYTILPTISTQTKVTEVDFATKIREMNFSGNITKRPNFSSLTKNPKQKLEKINHLKLAPHITVLPSDQNLLLCDLSWQTFHQIPTEHVRLDDQHCLYARTSSGENILARLNSADFAFEQSQHSDFYQTKNRRLAS